MTVRPTLLPTIQRVRQLLRDNPSGTGVSHFTNDEIQAALDAIREDVNYMALEIVPTFVPEGDVPHVYYFNYYGLNYVGGRWEEGYRITNASQQPVIPTLGEISTNIAHFQFAEQPRFPLFLTGHWFDTYQATSDLLIQWAADVMLRFDIDVNGARMARSQMHAMLLQQANRYLAKARPKLARWVRTDGTRGPNERVVDLDIDDDQFLRGTVTGVFNW